MRLILLSFICLLHLPLEAQEGDYFFEQVTSEEGITFNAVSSVVEDDYGFIWFGTAGGLYYYNSNEIIRYRFDPENKRTPPTNNITNLYNDRAGRIWVSTYRGLCYFDEPGNAFVRVALTLGADTLREPRVADLLQYDSLHYLVIVNGLLYRFRVGEYALHPVDLGEEVREVTFLGRLADDRLYVGTADGQVLRRQGSSLQFSFVYQAPAAVRTLCYANNKLWLGLAQGEVWIVPDNEDGGRSLQALFPEVADEYFGKLINKIVQHKNGEIWIGTVQGIVVVREEAGATTLRRITKGLPHIGVFELFVDRTDGIWVGTWSGGLAYHQEHNYHFPHFKLPNSNKTITRSVVSSFGEAKDGSIWVGVENGNLHRFLPDEGTFVVPANTTGKWPVERVKAIATGGGGSHHWFGTLYDGLWRSSGGRFTRYDETTGITSSVLPVADGVWVGTRGDGVIFYDLLRDHTRRFTAGKGSISSNFVWQVYEDSRKNIWICTDSGLSVKYHGQAEFHQFYHQRDSSSLSRNLNYTIAEDQQGQLWIGSAGAGIDIFDPLTQTFRKFSHNVAIAQAEVYCILPDLAGNMWFSTDQGIYLFDPECDDLRHFTTQDGALGKQYHPNSGFRSSRGTLFFGGGNGFNVIDPLTVTSNPLQPKAYIAYLRINNAPFTEQRPQYVNADFPAAINHLELAYHQNTLTFGLAANNLIKPQNNKFKYRMPGYIDEWIEVPHGTDITFTKIPQGDYTLEVLASNNDGVWGKEVQQIAIHVCPPFWLAWYAWLTYALLAVLGIFLLFRDLRLREQSRAAQILFSEKAKFFTNVSHELRTPLTLVTSPLSKLLERYANDPTAYPILRTVQRNTERLVHLTNQILDFRLIELDKVKLRKERTDMVALCDQTFEYFEYDAQVKRVECVFNAPFATYPLFVDVAKMEIVTYNLISNALKHSPERGRVILSMEQRELREADYGSVFCAGKRFFGEALSISVSDMGKGIDPAVLSHIFDRFYVEDDQINTGIGIGLHMCQEYVQLHEGNIMVRTRPARGTTFIVNIPVDQAAVCVKADRIIRHRFKPVDAAEKTEKSDRKRERLILYVEDNDELRAYLKQVMATRYKVLTAKSAQQALQIGKEVLPDLIISDIVLSGMNGIELTRQFKADPATSHIPVLLLTALSDEKHKIDSMSSGAHTFITKPVEEGFLLAKIQNILRSQQNLINRLAHHVPVTDTLFSTRSSFVEKARQLVELNVSNASFSVAEFAEKLNVSRSSLQRKLKADFNLSPTEFIRNVRLLKAVELMKTSTYNIDEIALMVGFNSTSYFIRSFKKQYGKTPHVFQVEMNLKAKGGP